jgi:hypothetical protein
MGLTIGMTGALVALAPDGGEDTDSLGTLDSVPASASQRGLSGMSSQSSQPARHNTRLATRDTAPDLE